MRRSEEFYPIRRDRERGPARPGAEPGFSAFGGSPWQMMRRMQEDMDRIFGQFFGPVDFGGLAGAGGFGGAGTALASAAAQQWAPSVDISQSHREWCIEADLPGVDRDNIDVQVQDGYLTITAELRQEEGPQGEESPGQAQNQGQQGQGQGQQRQYHRRERRYGYFERVIPLPENVDEDQIACEFRKGVLTVHVPKTAQQPQQARRIPIHEGTTQGSTAGLGAGQGTGRRAGAATTGTSGTTRGRQQADEEEALAGAKGGERRSGEASGGSRPSNWDPAAGQGRDSGGSQRPTGKRKP